MCTDLERLPVGHRVPTAQTPRPLGVNLEIVWAVVQKDLPTLRVAVEVLLKDS